MNLVSIENRPPDRPLEVDDELWGLLVACWSREGSRRPAVKRMRDTASSLKQMQARSTEMKIEAVLSVSDCLKPYNKVY
ncbi:hypothetical protein FRC08_015349 [Ceratobasidium sp. 394]|nr:hypothetical protein FRC08_015349 [Ceratobasidium sp. 394]KAG9090950.1 hypothetical protein FS749_000168 [Ceratobasidium sp. UAMH 11750]